MRILGCFSHFRHVGAIFLLIFNQVVADEDESELSYVYGDQDYISIATGAKQLIKQAPAVASVITSADIIASGAADFDELLMQIPGLYASRAGMYEPLNAVRGVYSEYSNQVLVLVNGVSQSQILYGGRGPIPTALPLILIDRIEVIRGPGSAVYGADAFAGVINIITKEPAKSESSLGLRVESFNSKKLQLQYQSNIGEVSTLLTFEGGKSAGDDSIVDSDLQTVLDSAFGTQASLAPGKIRRGGDSIDLHLYLNYQGWKFRSGYQSRLNFGTGVGFSSVLDPIGKRNIRNYYAELVYETKSLSDWNSEYKISYFKISAKQSLQLFPPGSTGGGTEIFSEGVLGVPEYNEKHVRGEVSTFFTGLEKHRVRVGAGFDLSGFDNIEDHRNFDANNQPLGEFIEATDIEDLVFLSPHKREVYYFFVQDEWNIAPDWDFTLGLRFDEYSDFGSTFNPRLALVWQASYNLTVKALYGRAFRAPSIIELYVENNPSVLGNRNLNPETMDTYEIAFNYKPTGNLDLNFNLFHYEIDDLIEQTIAAKVKVFDNSGVQKGKGFEAEFDWSVSQELSIKGNYAYQRSKNKLTHSDAGHVPHHQVYLRGDWKFASKWLLNFQSNWIGERERVVGDPRSDLGGYTKTDLHLRYGDEYSPWNISVGLKNVFNDDIREPTISPGFVPNDLPLPGRVWFFELSTNI